MRIASEESLEQAQGYVRAFDLALWALLIAAIVLGVLAVWLAPSIPVGAVRVGIAAAIAALAGWGLVQVLAARVADAATTADGRVAITEIIQSLVNGLNGSAFALGVIGIGVAASGFIVDRQSRQAARRGGGRRNTGAGDSSSASGRPRRSPHVVDPAAKPAPSTPEVEAPPAEAPESEASAPDATPKPKPATRRRRRPPAAGA